MYVCMHVCMYVCVYVCMCASNPFATIEVKLIWIQNFPSLVKRKQLRSGFEPGVPDYISYDDNYYANIYIYIYIYIGQVGRVFTNSLGDLGSIPARVIPKTIKMIPSCLTLSIIRYESRVKWSNPGKGLAPSHTPRCSSYWKGWLLVALDYSRQLYSHIL